MVGTLLNFTRLRWTGGNCGTKAIETFTVQHQCNYLCQLLGLDRCNSTPLLEDSLAPPPPPPLLFPPITPPKDSTVVSSYIPNHEKNSCRFKFPAQTLSFYNEQLLFFCFLYHRCSQSFCTRNNSQSKKFTNKIFNCSFQLHLSLLPFPAAFPGHTSEPPPFYPNANLQLLYLV